MSHEDQIKRHAQLFELLRQQQMAEAALKPLPERRRAEAEGESALADLLQRATASLRPAPVRR